MVFIDLPCKCRAAKHLREPVQAQAYKSLMDDLNIEYQSRACMSRPKMRMVSLVDVDSGKCNEEGH